MACHITDADTSSVMSASNELLSAKSASENIITSGVSPLLTKDNNVSFMLMYFILQRYFVESIDRTGITGE